MNRRSFVGFATKAAAAAAALPFIASSPVAQEAVQRLSVELEPIEGEAGAVVVPIADGGGAAFLEMEGSAFRAISDAPDWVTVGAYEVDGTAHTAEAYWNGNAWEGVVAYLNGGVFQQAVNTHFLMGPGGWFTDGPESVFASFIAPQLNTAPEQQALARLFASLR